MKLKLPGTRIASLKANVLVCTGSAMHERIGTCTMRDPTSREQWMLVSVCRV